MEVAILKKPLPNKKKADSGPRINEQIRVDEVRLIDDEGQQVGVVKTTEALAIARSKSLDLVEISPMAEPPVCKIIDYGKFKYELSKKEKDNKKKQHVVSVKTIQFKSVNIDDNDLNVKANNVRKFLAEGDKVKVFLQYRGREVVHRDLGFELMKKFLLILDDVAKMEKDIEAEGPKRLTMMLCKK